MIAASYKSSNLSAIYHILRRVPSLESAASTITATSNTAHSGKKREQRSISLNV